MIQLSSTTVASDRTIQILIFSNHEQALAHICDHVLTRKESHYWLILIPEYRRIVDPTEDRELDDLAEAFWNGRKQDSLQKLYDGYAEAIAEDLQIAIHHSWYWEEQHHRDGTRCCGVGLSGVIVVWSKSLVVSGRLGFSIGKETTMVSEHDRLSNPRPRRSSKPIPKVVLADTELNRYEIFFSGWQSVRNEFLATFKEKECRSKCRELADSGPISIKRWRELVSNSQHDSE